MKARRVYEVTLTRERVVAVCAQVLACIFGVIVAPAAKMILNIFR